MKNLAKTILETYFGNDVIILKYENDVLEFRVLTEEPFDSPYTHNFGVNQYFTDVALMLDENENVEDVLNLMLLDVINN